MNIPSKESLRILTVLDTAGGIPADQLPNGYEWSLLPHLVETHAVNRFCILSPGREPEYPNGLWAYETSSTGREILEKANEQFQQETQQNAKETRRYIWARIEFWLGLLVGWILGAFTPKEVFDWISSFLH